MLRRTALAVLGDTYTFIRDHLDDRYVRLTNHVRHELGALISLAPWLQTSLENPWLPQVFATDASTAGYGVVVTEATEKETRAEARFGEMRGWLVCVDDDYSCVEEAVWSDPA